MDYSKEPQYKRENTINMARATFSYCVCLDTSVVSNSLRSHMPQLSSDAITKDPACRNED